MPFYNKNMNIISVFSRIFNGHGGNSGTIVQPVTNPWLLNGDFDDYMANFADIRPIVERFASVVPFAADDRGNRLADPQALRVLAAPNDQMCFYDFADYLASSILSQPFTYIRVLWRENAPRTSDNIIGYTFLPVGSKVVNGDGSYYFQYFNGVEQVRAESDEVISFYYSMSTDAFGVGVSPAQASKKWATIADYIASYQAGFFRNGAKPDGMFIITANSKEQYTKAVEKMEAIHRRGEAGHFSYQYAYRPTDENGNPLKASSVEWVSFGANNNELSLSDLIDRTQQKMDSVYGVPAIARGNDATATYSNAQVSDRNLAGRVDYLLRRVWFRFWHELERVCVDDIAWHISYDYEVPALADSDKVKAETDQLRATTLLALVNAGADVKDAAVALGLDDEWQKLDLQRQDNNTPVENSSDTSVNSLTIIKKSKAKPTSKPTTAELLRRVIIRENKSIADACLTQKNASSDEQAAVDAFVARIREVLDAGYLASADGAIAEILKLNPDFVAPTAIDAVEDALWFNRLQAVAGTHRQSVRDAVTAALQDAAEQELTAGERTKLINAIIQDPQRSTLMANEEVAASSQFANLHSYKAIAKANHLNCYKVWHCVHDGCACGLCQKMNGKKVAIDDAFASKGDTITDDAGTDYHVGFLDFDVPQAHPRCRCTFDTVWSATDDDEDDE